MDTAFNFGDMSATSIEGSQLAPFLNRPYIGKARLVDVAAETIKGRTSDEEYDVIDFTFEMLDGDVAGFQYRHRIFKHKFSEKSQDSAEVQLKKWGERLAYLMKYFIGVDSTLKIMHHSKSFEALRNNIKAAFDQLKPRWSPVVVIIKIVGYASSKAGKTYANLELPRYLGFLADEKSTTPLAFGKKEVIGNAEYLAAQDASSNATPADALEEEAPTMSFDEF